MYDVNDVKYERDFSACRLYTVSGTALTENKRYEGRYELAGKKCGSVESFEKQIESVYLFEYGIRPLNNDIAVTKQECSQDRYP